jgi:hypothetical protein
LAKLTISSEDGQTSNKPVDTGPEVLIVQAVLSGVHGDEWVADNVFKEWSHVDLTQDESKGICVWVTEHDEFVP